MKIYTLFFAAILVGLAFPCHAQNDSSKAAATPSPIHN